MELNDLIDFYFDGLGNKYFTAMSYGTWYDLL